MSEIEFLIEEYNNHPVNNCVMNDATISRHEGNFICGDDLTVYLKLQGDLIEKMTYDGNPSNITMAASGFISELVVGQKIDEVMTWNYNTMIENGFEVSPKRKRAAVIALLAIRNAVHQWRGDKNEKGEILEEDFEDLFDE